MMNEDLRMCRQRMPMEQLAELLLLQMDNGGRARLTVTGYSMMPMLRNCADTVELVRPKGRCKRGDIILYRRENGQYVLHRIIAVKGSGYICSGDNQAMREPVTAEQVVAVMDGFFRGGRNYTLRHVGYRLYTAAWVGLFPLRGAYIAVRRRLGKLRRMLKK